MSFIDTHTHTHTQTYLEANIRGSPPGVESGPWVAHLCSQLLRAERKGGYVPVRRERGKKKEKEKEKERKEKSKEKTTQKIDESIILREQVKGQKVAV